MSERTRAIYTAKQLKAQEIQSTIKDALCRCRTHPELGPMKDWDTAIHVRASLREAGFEIRRKNTRRAEQQARLLKGMPRK